VHKALSMALEKDKNILVVLMNAAQLEAEAQGEELNPRSIIENLIRRLYTAIRYREGLENKIKKHVENLYKKTVSKDFKLTESFIRRSERIEEDKEEIAREVLLDEKFLHIVIFIAFWTLGAIILTFNLTPWEWVNKLVALLSTFPIPYVVNLTYRKRKVRKERRKASLKTEELYQLDNKIGNLEFDLEQIHSEITSSNKEFPNGKKLVYVIDELDKLDRNMVMEVLKYFKNLFTLSDALFIFIGGEELYNIGREEVENSVLYRQKEYTYFISRYFLSRPLYPDLSRFFDEIIEDWGELTEKEIFKRSLLFDAKNDYFDLKTYIRDKITGFEDGKPVIEINEGDLSTYEQKARFHKAITSLVEGKYLSYEHSKWQENEKLFRAIFEDASKIYNLLPGQQFSDPAGGEVKDELIRDFHSLLYRCSAFEIQNETSQNIRGISVPIRIYRYVGHIPTDPPDNLEEPMEYERRFIAKFEEWAMYLISVANPFREIRGDAKVSKEEFSNDPQTILKVLAGWGYDVRSPFNSYKNTYDNISGKKPPYPYRREVVENTTSDISNRLQQFKEKLPALIGRAITQLYSNLRLQFQNLQQNPNLFSGSANQIRQVFNKYNPVVVFKPELDRQLLLIHDHWEEIEQIKDVLKDNQHTHRIVCVEENLESEEEIPGLSIFLTQTPEKLESSIKALYEDLEKLAGNTFHPLIFMRKGTSTLKSPSSLKF